MDLNKHLQQCTVSSAILEQLIEGVIEIEVGLFALVKIMHSLFDLLRIQLHGLHDAAGDAELLFVEIKET